MLLLSLNLSLNFQLPLNSYALFRILFNMQPCHFYIDFNNFWLTENENLLASHSGENDNEIDA